MMYKRFLDNKGWLAFKEVTEATNFAEHICQQQAQESDENQLHDQCVLIVSTMEEGQTNREATG